MIKSISALTDKIIKILRPAIASDLAQVESLIDSAANTLAAAPSVYVDAYTNVQMLGYDENRNPIDVTPDEVATVASDLLGQAIQRVRQTIADLRDVLKNVSEKIGSYTYTTKDVTWDFTNRYKWGSVSLRANTITFDVADFKMDLYNGLGTTHANLSFNSSRGAIQAYLATNCASDAIWNTSSGKASALVMTHYVMGLTVPGRPSVAAFILNISEYEMLIPTDGAPNDAANLSKVFPFANTASGRDNIIYARKPFVYYNNKWYWLHSGTISYDTRARLLTLDGLVTLMLQAGVLEETPYQIEDAVLQNLLYTYAGDSVGDWSFKTTLSSALTNSALSTVAKASGADAISGRTTWANGTPNVTETENTETADITIESLYSDTVAQLEEATNALEGLRDA